MARTIEYNPEVVLTQAMHLFWEKGYESTSIQDIVKATGLKPGSLYAAYGNKEGIFNAVIAMYSTNSLEKVEDILNAQGNKLKNIENFLNLVIIDVISNTDHHGCLLVKTLLVISHKDKKIQEQIVTFYKQLQPLVEKLLETSKKEGLTTVDAAEYTSFIFSTIYGTHAHFKTFGEKNILQQNVSILMRNLKS